MAAPSITSVTVTNFGSAATSHAVTMPATVTPGDLLVIIFGIYDGGGAVTTPGGWTLIQTAGTGAGEPDLNIYGKVAVGDEDGATVDVVSAVGRKARAHVLRVVAAEWEGTLALGLFSATPASGESANSNPPNLAPSPGSQEYRFVACAVHEDDLTTSGYPTNYADNQTQGNSGTAGSDVHLQTASRALTAASDDPGTFTVEASTSWVAATLAIAPPSAAPIIDDVDPDTFADTDTGIDITGENYGASAATAASPSITDSTPTTDATAGTTVAASYPATVAPGDLLIFVVAKDDDATGITDTTGGLNVIVNGNTESGTDGVCLFVGWMIAVGNEDGGTRTFTGDSEEWQTYCIRVAAGTFDPENPIDSFAVLNGGTTGECVTNAFDTVRAGCLIVAAGAVDIDPMDATFAPVGWTDGHDTDAGEVTAWWATRDALSTAAETVSAATFGINASDANTCTAFAIAPNKSKIELADSGTYAGSTKVTQTITGWTDTALVFTAVQGGLSEGSLWVYVTNTSGFVSAGFPVTLGGGVEVGLAGAQPAATGAIALVKRIVSLAGAQPASTGGPTAAGLKYLVSLAGAQPAPTGTLFVKTFEALAGDQPSATGAIAFLYNIALAGNQPSATGSLSADGLKYLVSLAGNQPAPSGALIVKTFLGLAGSQPSASGALALVKYLLGLAGNQPSATGAVDGVILIDGGTLEGNQPAATGTIDSLLLATVGLAGNQPASTGAFALVKAFVNLAGSQPNATGSLALAKYLLGLGGNQPNATGALLVKYLIALAGAQPASTGTIAAALLGVGATLEGNQPASTGTLTAEEAFGMLLLQLLAFDQSLLIGRGYDQSVLIGTGFDRSPTHLKGLS